MWAAPSHLLRAWTEQKKGGRRNSLFLNLGEHLFLSSDIEAPGSWAFQLQDLYQGPLVLRPCSPGLGVTWSAPLVLRPLGLYWTIPPAFLILQLVDSKLWNFLASVTSWGNYYSIYTLSLSIFYRFYFSGEPLIEVAIYHLLAFPNGHSQELHRGLQN